MSFILRTVFKNGDPKNHSEINKYIGDNYQFIHREFNPADFARAFQTCFEKPHLSDDDPKADNFTTETYAFLHYNSGADIIPLYKNQYNYIMTESGKTFANITYK